MSHYCRKCENRERGEIPGLKPKSVSQEIIGYVEREIIPRYAAFDKGHREDHVRKVIEQSLKLAEHEPMMDTDMVYVVGRSTTSGS